MKFFLLITIGCAILTKTQSQTLLDSSSNFESAKYLLLGEQKTINLRDFEKKYLPYIKIKTLKSNGFKHVQFILLEYRGFINNNEISDSEFKKNNVPHSCDFIVAFIGGIYFRLKGFINNDFYQFIEYYSENSDSGFVLKRDLFSNKKIKSINGLLKQRNIFIEDIDLNCYYKYYQLQQEVHTKLKNNFCSESCIENSRKNF